jgi:hypothetical protein
MKLPRHGQGRSLDVHVAQLVAMPLAPEKGVEIPVGEAVDRRGQLALKGEAPHLAVRDDVEPGLLLQGEGLVDGRVLHLREAVPRRWRRFELLPRLEQRRPGAAGCRRRRCGPRARAYFRAMRVRSPLRAEARVARMRDILVLCPQERDLVAIRAAGLEDRYRVRYEGSDLDQLEVFEPEPFLEHAETLPADGVIGTKDLSALLASIVAERAGCRARRRSPSSRSSTSRPRATCSGSSRRSRRRSSASSTDGIPCDPPFFAKPVVGRLSQNTYRIDDLSELSKLHEADRYTNRYAEIAAIAGGDPARRARVHRRGAPVRRRR